MKILQFSNPEDRKILESVSWPVNYFTLLYWSVEMKKICNETKAVWIASNQIWILERFFYMNTKNNQQLYVNPVLIKWVWSIESSEWCLSFKWEPEKIVKRFKKVYVSFYDEDNNLYKQTLEVLEARVFQHELDHLNWITI